MLATLSMPARVGTLRVRAAPRDGPGLRAGLDLAIATVDLRPPGLPPAAILVVRRLADAKPGSVHLRGEAASVDAAWAAATRAAIERLAAQAARPARGPVGRRAEAVLFSDRAELVACLLADVLRGEAGDRWWWRLILPELAPGGRAAEVMVAEAEVVPPAMRMLESLGLAAALVLSLDDAEVLRVLGAVAATHGAAAVAEMMNRRLAMPPPDGSPPPWPGSRAPGGRLPGPAPSPPWERYLAPGAVPTGLKPPAAVLLAVSLLLVVRAAAVRSAPFVGDLERWLLAPGTDTGVDRSTAAEVAARAPGGRLIPPGAPARAGGQAAPTPVSAFVDPTPEAADLVPSGQAIPDRPSRPSAPPDGAPSRHRADRRNAPSAESDAAGHEAVDDADDAGETGTATELAGAFYLVHLLERLGLPECFEPAWSPADSIGTWSLLEAVARSLVPAERASDPLWAILANLDGRDPTRLPGEAVPAAPAYRIPVAWLMPFAGATPAVYWAGKGGRLCTWAEPGFVLTDGPGRPARSAALDQVAAYRLEPLRRRPFADARRGDLGPTAAGPLAPGISRWLTLAGPYLRHRLAAELAVPAADAAAELILRPGHVYATRTHVDVVLPLDAASVPVRRSGMDRNPGWVPALGRVVAFHFE